MENVYSLVNSENWSCYPLLLQNAFRRVRAKKSHFQNEDNQTTHLFLFYLKVVLSYGKLHTPAHCGVKSKNTFLHKTIV